MAKGRIPKPKVINDLKGDTHKRRRHQAEPVPPKNHPVCPDYLDIVAKAEWKSVTEQLDQMGLLSSADSTALELYCSAYSRYRDAEEKVRRFGEVIVSPVNKYPMVSPYSTIMNRNLDTCRRMLIEFGLTPASRARCAVPIVQKENEKWNGILNIAS